MVREKIKKLKWLNIDPEKDAPVLCCPYAFYDRYLAQVVVSETLIKNLQGHGINKEEITELIMKNLNSHSLKVSLLLTAMNGITDNKVLRFGSILLPSTPYGAVHTALKFGCHVVEWGHEELIIPQPDFSHLLVEIDLAKYMNWQDRFMNLWRKISSLFSGESVINFGEVREDTLLKVAQICVSYNTNTYSLVWRNCQTFVDEILEKCEIPKERLQEGALGVFLNKIKQDGGGVSMTFYGRPCDTRLRLYELLLEVWNESTDTDRDLLKAYYNIYRKRNEKFKEGERAVRDILKIKKRYGIRFREYENENWSTRTGRKFSKTI